MATGKETSPIIHLRFEGFPIWVQMGGDGSVWYTAKPFCTALGFKKMTEALERHVKRENQQARALRLDSPHRTLLSRASSRGLCSAKIPQIASPSITVIGATRTP